VAATTAPLSFGGEPLQVASIDAPTDDNLFA